jgi:hypothetical protein
MIGQLVADIPCRLSLIPPQETERRRRKKKTVTREICIIVAPHSIIGISRFTESAFQESQEAHKWIGFPHALTNQVG